MSPRNVLLLLALNQTQDRPQPQSRVCSPITRPLHHARPCAAEDGSGLATHHRPTHATHAACSQALAREAGGRRKQVSRTTCHWSSGLACTYGTMRFQTRHALHSSTAPHRTAPHRQDTMQHRRPDRRPCLFRAVPLRICWPNKLRCVFMLAAKKSGERPSQGAALNTKERGGVERAPQNDLSEWLQRRTVDAGEEPRHETRLPAGRWGCSDFD